MPLTPPLVIVEPFAKNAIAPYITLPLPVPDQNPVTPGAASFDTGFTVVNMTPVTAGGVPPFGRDMNGLLYMLSDYCAWIQGGGQFRYDASFVAANTGYAVGVILQSATDVKRFYLNLVANNANNPDVDDTGWLPYSPIGTSTDLAALPCSGSFTLTATPNLGLLDLTPSAPATLTNLATTADNNGQILIICNLSASQPLTIQTNARMRLATDITLLQNSTLTIRYFFSIDAWVPL